MSVTAQTLHSALLKQIETIQLKKFRVLYMLFPPRLCSCGAAMKIYQTESFLTCNKVLEI